jgi:membrane protein DedA with SNARE-associated domain
MIQTSMILSFISTYRYLALLPLAIIEGPILALFIGFMVHLGYFSIIPAYIVMILGDFIPDSIYYFIGRFGHKDKIIKKFNNKSESLSKHLNRLENLWHKNPLKTMFICKLAFGLSVPLLITAGMVKLPYKKFVWQALIVTIFQYGVLMTVGYYLGQSYQLAIPYIKYAGIIIAGIVILFMAIYFTLQIYIKNKVIENKE